MSKFVIMDRAYPNKKLRVIEYNNGCAIGQWIGYWNREKKIFNLYPNKHATGIRWPNKIIPTEKIVMSAYQMYINTPECKHVPFLSRSVKIAVEV